MNKDINPLDWHNSKFLDYIPAHFVKVKFRHQDQRDTVLQWLQHNVNGRYAIEAISSKQSTDEGTAPFMSLGSSFWHEEHYIGFEEPAEATMYAMFYK